jgi:hypothetical protein
MLAALVDTDALRKIAQSRSPAASSSPPFLAAALLGTAAGASAIAIGLLAMTHK